MTRTKTGKRQTQKLEGVRADKKVDCYPTLAIEIVQRLDDLSGLKGVTRASMAADVAHHCLWSVRILEQLQPYLHIAAALSWDAGDQANVFHCWLANRTIKDIRPRLDDARGEQGQRVKFRISQEDRRRLQVIAYALGGTAADTLWPVLFGLALTDAQSVYTLTRERGLAITGRHPLTGEWVETESWGTAL